MTNPKIVQGRAIAQAQAQDQSRSIPYRPQYNLITNKVTASILLQQISYWWHISNRKPFYKFRAPCEHEQYREGDSWTEELGISGGQFDTALKAIGKKVTQGTKKTALLKENLVVYWTDSGRVTWYQLNETLFYALLYIAYHEPETLGNLGFRNLTGNTSFRNFVDNTEAPNYLYSETTSEITPEIIAAAAAEKPKTETLNDYSQTLREYEKLFGGMGGALQYERFGDLWDEYPTLEAHEYARGEMYKAMMREDKPVSPNLRYYARCLETANQRNWTGGDPPMNATQRRRKEQYPSADPTDPAIKRWLEEERKRREEATV